MLLQMFCAADPCYDKSLQQLQSFLSGLVSEEKLDLRDGMYFLKKWKTESKKLIILHLNRLGEFVLEIKLNGFEI